MMNNPVTVAQNIDFIFCKFGQKSYSVVHILLARYSIMIYEMQGQGTEHFQSAFHVNDALHVNFNKFEHCIVFIDTQKNDPLYNLGHFLADSPP